MSDLAATNCSGGCGSFNNNGCSCGNNLIWIILLLCCCGNGSSLFDNGGCGCGNDNNNCMWIVLLLLCCGGCGC